MRIQTDLQALRQECWEARSGGARVGFVPTMGFLHRGHTSLFALARGRCDLLVASIFVNPLQFSPEEDLERYPRDAEGDAAKARAEGVDLLFMPDSLYEPDHATRVSVPALSAGFEGAARPTHFEGVATVVARLFGLVQPSLAVFGEKDYQQLQVIRQMVRDLAMPIEILGGPLVRDDDGLALSSRNAYLSAEERARGLSLHQALFAMREGAAAGEREISRLRALGISKIKADTLDYLEVVDAASLLPLQVLDRPARALVAGRFGRTRLLDNVELQCPA